MPYVYRIHLLPSALPHLIPPHHPAVLEDRLSEVRLKASAACRERGRSRPTTPAATGSGPACRRNACCRGYPPVVGGEAGAGRLREIDTTGQNRDSRTGISEKWGGVSVSQGSVHPPPLWRRGQAQFEVGGIGGTWGVRRGRGCRRDSDDNHPEEAESCHLRPR